MRKILTAAALACASLTLAAACAGADAQKQPGQKQSAQKQAEQKSPEQKQSSSAAPGQSGAKRPTVAEIREDGLKSLLKAGESRERPLLVNFWATWCAPCREEFPDLVKLRGRYDAERLDLALVSLDDVSDIETAVPEFLLESGAASLPAYLLHADDDDAAINSVDPTWGGELPATFLYDRTGRLVYTHKGRIKPAELQTEIDKTLKAAAK